MFIRSMKPFFLLVTIYSQKAIQKFVSAKINFFEIFDCQNSTKIQPKFKKNHQIFIHGSNIAKNIEGCLKSLTFIFSL